MTPPPVKTRPISGAPLAPPGWSRNPSEWSERLPVAALALVGLVIACYLGLYQAGVFRSVWEPVFGSGSQTVLNSAISRLLPVPDAFLGALGYLVEVITCLWGGPDRWKSKPRVVLVFGLTAALMAIAGVVLAMLQPIALGTWCSLCLASAAISVAIVGPSMKEVLASLQHLQRLRNPAGAWDGVPSDQPENPQGQGSEPGSASEKTLIHSTSGHS